jgi:HD-GYP domain-containing protein (c-di-GMP phosphodiesterase class II)
MNQVLIVLEDKQLATIIQGKLEHTYKIQSVIRHSGVEAISMLQILPFDLIICKDKIKDEFTGHKICDYLSTHKEDFEKEVEVLLIGQNFSDYQKLKVISPQLRYEKIVTLSGFLLGLEKTMPSLEIEPVAPPVAAAAPAAPVPSGDDKTTVFVLPKGGLKAQLEKTAEIKIAPKYYPFHIRYLVHVPENSILDFNIYTRMKKGDEFEYNLKLASGAKLTKADLEKLLMRTSKELFVTKDEAKKASEYLNRYFMEKFRRTDLDASQRMLINSDGFEILLETFKTSSFDKFSVEIIKELVKSIDLLMKIENPLAHFKKFIATNKMSFGYTHTHFSCLLIFQIIDSFDWAREQSKNKIIYLSLFHDLCLGSDRMIKLHHKFFQEQKNLTEEEKQLMLGHAEAAAGILETIVKAPKELTSLVREHHGLKSGKGFAESLTIAISSLSMAFIVAEDLVTQYLEMVEKLDKTKSLEPSVEQMTALFGELKKKYDKLTYADVVLAYQKLFLGA